MFNWQSLFIYDERNPMIFTNSIFWIFFGVALLIYMLIYQKRFWRNLFLLGFSLFFYYKAGGYFFFLILFSTVIDYIIGQAVYDSKKELNRRLLVTLSLFINLGLLSYFKYSYFFTDVFNHAFQTNFVAIDYLALWSNNLFGSSFDIAKIILPVGISFYTFQTISYTLDIYRGQVKPVENILDFAFYVSFFPQLVAGPIVRAADFVPQIYQEYRLSAQEYGYAIFLILNGLVKKILISDYISINFVDRVFASPERYSGFENLMAVYGYAIQIYCDFSGYTDIAIGLALLLGFRLNINFNSPYVADSITDFWRRWHISLSSWLRDYLYISLGGNRGISLFTYISVPLSFLILLLAEGWQWENLLGLQILLIVWLLWRAQPSRQWLGYVGALLSLSFGIYLLIIFKIYSGILSLLIGVFWAIIVYEPARSIKVATYVNLSLTMLLGGLWHGASIRFIIWGALHGAALAIHKFWLEITGSKGVKHPVWRRFIGQFITFQFVCFCWIYFRASNMDIVQKMLKQIAFSFQLVNIPTIVWAYKEIFLIMLLGYVVHWLPREWKEEVQAAFLKTPDLAKAFIIALLVIVLYQARSADIQPFIYFQF